MNTRIPRLIALASILAAPSVFGLSAGDELTLKLRFEPGKTRFFEESQKIEQAFDMGQGGEPMTMTMDDLTCFKVVAHPPVDGKTTLAYTYDRTAMNVDSATMPPIHYDSDGKNDEDEAGQVEVIFKPMLGETVEIEIGPGGRPISAKGLDKIVAKIDHEAAGNMFWTRLKETLNPGAFMAQTIDAHAALLPEKPVKIGDTWKATVKATGMSIGTMVFDYTCKLKAVESAAGHKIAVIDYAIAMSIDPDSKPTGQAAAMNIKMESGKGAGTAWFDIDAGEFIRSAGDSTTNMTIEMGANKGSIKQKLHNATRWLSEKERAEQRAGNANKSGGKAGGDDEKKEGK